MSQTLCADGHYVDMWWEPHTRSWVIQLKNPCYDQVDSAIYVGSKAEAVRETDRLVAAHGGKGDIATIATRRWEAIRVLMDVLETGFDEPIEPEVGEQCTWRGVHRQDAAAAIAKVKSLLGGAT